MANLKILTGDSKNQVIPLNKPETLIGRKAECDLVLQHPGVSREHARVVRNGLDYQLVDLFSKSTTKLNKFVLPPGQNFTLRSGDRIVICDLELLFHNADQHNNDIGNAPDTGSTIQIVNAVRSDAEASLVRPEVKLKAILEISRKLSSNFDLNTVAPEILESLMGLYPLAERAFLVLLKCQKGKRWNVEKLFHKIRPNSRPGPFSQQDQDESPRLSHSIISEVVEQKQSVLRQYSDDDKNLSTSASIADLRIHSVMCVPLLDSDREILGLLQIDTSNLRQFNQEDLDVLDTVARQASIAIQNVSLHERILSNAVILRDLDLAATIQQQFLPGSVPERDGFQFFAYYHAARQIGGDYYDFVPLDRDRIAIALGDVSGKGIAAALLMAKFSGDTRASILTEREPGPALTLTNALLCAAGIDDKFITLSLCQLDYKTGRLVYATAGHEPLLVRRASGQIEEFGDLVREFPLGIDATVEYRQSETLLEPGDVAIIYSDGVTDARSPEEDRYDTIEHRRLKKRIESLSGGPAIVGKGVLQEIREFCKNHPQADDITMICFGPTET